MSENVDNNKILENDYIFNVIDNVDYNYMIKYNFVIIGGWKYYYFILKLIVIFK